MTDRIDSLVDQLRTGAMRKCSARPTPSSFCASWDGPRLKRFARRMYPLAGMPMREIVRKWKRNGRTTVNMWLAPEKISGSRYPTPEFVEWLYYAARENCARCNIIFPDVFEVAA